METTLYVLLNSHQDQPLADRIFWGAMSGLFLLLLTYIYGRFKHKRDEKKQKKKLLQQKNEQECLIARELFDEDPFDGNDSKLFDELKEKCNPQNFLEPYDAQKIERSNNIYSKLDSAKYDIEELERLRDSAISDLGIAYHNTALYNNLCTLFNPQQFMGENYDGQKLQAANQYYAKVLANKGNDKELEKIYEEISKNRKSEINVESNSTPTTGSKIKMTILYFIVLYGAIQLISILLVMAFFLVYDQIN